jgi:hypothetical protein
MGQSYYYVFFFLLCALEDHVKAEESVAHAADKVC